jgi:hypothetical protein
MDGASQLTFTSVPSYSSQSLLSLYCYITVAVDTTQLNNPNWRHYLLCITLICAYFLLQEKYSECGKQQQRQFEDSNNKLLLPSAASQMPHSGTKQYDEESHLMSDRYLATMQTVMEQLSNHLELQHSG